MHAGCDAGLDLDLDGFLRCTSPVTGQSCGCPFQLLAWRPEGVVRSGRPRTSVRLAGSRGAAEILHAGAAQLDVEDEMRGWLVVAAGDGLGHRADPYEGRAVGNDRARSGAIVGHLPPRPRLIA